MKILTTVAGEWPKFNAHGRKEAFSVRDAILQQLECGIDIVTDGCVYWNDPIIHQALKYGAGKGGIERWFDTNFLPRQPIISNALDKNARFNQREFIDSREEFYKARREKSVEYGNRMIKPVLSGALTLALHSKNQFYGSFEELALAYARKVNEELSWYDFQVPSSTTPFVQVNEPALTQALEEGWNREFIFKVLERQFAGRDYPICIQTFFGDLKFLENDLHRIPVKIIGLDLANEHGNVEILEKGLWPKEKILNAGIVNSRNVWSEKQAGNAGQLLKLSIETAEKAGTTPLYVTPSHGLGWSIDSDQTRELAASFVEVVDSVRNA